LLLKLDVSVTDADIPPGWQWLSAPTLGRLESTGSSFARAGAVYSNTYSDDDDDADDDLLHEGGEAIWLEPLRRTAMVREPTVG
jgi:hypothetical protein